MINNNQYNNDVIFPMLEFTIKYDEFKNGKYKHTDDEI